MSCQPLLPDGELCEDRAIILSTALVTTRPTIHSFDLFRVASAHEMEQLPLFCSLLYPPHLEQCVVHSRCSKKHFVLK